MNELILKHFTCPQHTGQFPEITIDIGQSIVKHSASASCVQLQILFDNQQVIIDIKYKAMGCGYLIAVGSFVSMHLLSQSLNEARALTAESIYNELLLPKVKYYCALLWFDALKQALSDYESKRRII